MATITVGPAFAYVDTPANDTLEIITVLSGAVKVESSTQLSVVNLFNYTYTFYGSGVVYDTSSATAGNLEIPIGGTINELKVTKADGSLAFDISQLNVSAAAFGQALWGVTNAAQNAYQLLLSGDDTFIGGPLNDAFNAASARNVTVQAGAGSNTLVGGTDVNTLVLTGKVSDYAIGKSSYNASYGLSDLRAGAPDGTDQVTNFQYVKFADATLPLVPLYITEYATTNVLRTNASATTYGGLTLPQYVLQVQAGGLTSSEILSQIVLQADSTTSVATMTYDFFTRDTPTLQGLDYLVNPLGGDPDNLNSAYYAQFSTTNRYINFAANLGKPGGVAAVSFAAVYGSLSLSDATAKAYGVIFGSTPTADKVSHLLGDLVPNGSGGTYARANYFAAYGGDGLTGIGTKAAMVGWLIAQADSAHVGSLETANAAYLTNLGMTGTTAFVDLVGTYGGTPYTGP